MTKNEFGAKSYEYAVGAIKATSHPPLTKDELLRLSDSEPDSFTKLLDEFGWARGIDGGILSRIEGELDYAISFIKDISPDESLTDLLFFETDAENLKLFIKGKLIDRDVSGLYDRRGTVPLEIIRGSVKAWDFSLISESVNNALVPYEKEDSPFILSLAVDRAVFSDTLKKAEKNSALYNMLIKYAEAKNRIAEARLITLEINEEKIKDLLLPVPYRSIEEGENAQEVIQEEKERITLALDTLKTGENFAPIAEYFFLKKEEAATLRRLWAEKSSREVV